MRLPAVTASHGVVFKKNGQVALRRVVIGIELDRRAIRFGRACQVAACAQIAPHQIVLQNIGQRALGQRRCRIELHGKTRFIARGLAQSRLKQHVGHLQMMHRCIRVQRNQRAITCQRLLHLALAQQRRALRFKIHQNRRPVNQIGDLVAQRGRLGRRIAPLHRIENKVRQHLAIFVSGEVLRQHRRTCLNGRVLRQLLGNESSGRNQLIVPFNEVRRVQPPVFRARLFLLIGPRVLLLVAIVLALQLVG